MVQQRGTITSVRMKMTKSGVKPSESAESVRDFIFGNYWVNSHKPDYHIEYPQAEAFLKRRAYSVMVDDCDSKTTNDAIKAANKIVDSIATAMDFLKDQGIELKVIDYEVYYEGNKYSLRHLFSSDK